MGVCINLRTLVISHDCSVPFLLERSTFVLMYVSWTPYFRRQRKGVICGLGCVLG